MTEGYASHGREVIGLFALDPIHADATMAKGAEVLADLAHPTDLTRYASPGRGWGV